MIYIRNTRLSDHADIERLCRSTYPRSLPWSASQIESHLRVFPEGQFVAVEASTGRIVGMAASLIVCRDHYKIDDSWARFTANGTFSNHDASKGRTLYGAEIMVATDVRGRGIGKRLYSAREQLVRQLNLERIRAGARLRGYSRFANLLKPIEYVNAVVTRKLIDPTLTFQLRRGFQVLHLAPQYLKNDPESLGYAAVIEWRNERLPRAPSPRAELEALTA